MPQSPTLLIRLVSRPGQVHAVLTHMTHEQIHTQLRPPSVEYTTTSTDEDWIHLEGVNDDDKPVDCWYLREMVCGYLIEEFDRAAAMLRNAQQQQRPGIIR